MTTPRRKSLLQLIEQIEAEAKPSTAPQNRAAILRQRDEISDAMAKGHTLRIIWQALHGAGRVKMSYPYFTQLVAKYVVGKGKNKPVKATPATENDANEATKEDEKEFVPSFPIIRSKFLYNSNFGVADPYGKRKESDKGKQ